MFHPTTAAPHVRRHSPGDLGHGIAICSLLYVVVSLEEAAVHCVLYGKSVLYCALAFHGQCVCTVVSYPTLSAGRHFIRRLPGSGKDCTQNRCTVLA